MLIVGCGYIGRALGARYLEEQRSVTGVVKSVHSVLLLRKLGIEPVAADFDAAVTAGKHVFMEKPVAVDAPGIRKVLERADRAKKKNLKVGVGLMLRHCPARRALYERIRAGEIGEIIAAARHDQGRSLGGVMFDDIGPNHRQGTAIFTDTFIQDAPPGDPNAAAWRNRMQFWTAVHEMGHAFNLAHAWQKALTEKKKGRR